LLDVLRRARPDAERDADADADADFIDPRLPAEDDFFDAVDFRVAVLAIAEPPVGKNEREAYAVQAREAARNLCERRKMQKRSDRRFTRSRVRR
jgi:hypothetical protein